MTPKKIKPDAQGLLLGCFVVFAILLLLLRLLVFVNGHGRHRARFQGTGSNGPAAASVGRTIRYRWLGGRRMNMPHEFRPRPYSSAPCGMSERFQNRCGLSCIVQGRVDLNAAVPGYSHSGIAIVSQLVAWHNGAETQRPLEVGYSES